MFPRLQDILTWISGTEIRLPGMTFGFFVALAFIAAYQVLRLEFRRRESAMEFRMDKVKIRISGPLSIRDVYIQVILWAAIGYKAGAGILNWEEFTKDPAHLIFSDAGSVIFAILAAVAAGGWRYYKYKKHLSDEIEYREVLLGPSRFLGTFLGIAFIAGLGGAKIFNWLEDPAAFILEVKNDFWATVFSADGLTFYGGLITAGFFIARFLYRRGYQLLHILDIFTAPMILAYGVGRIGCQLSGDGDWGIANLSPKPGILSFLPDWVWSYHYPHNVLHRGAAIPPSDCITPHCQVLCEDGFCHALADPVFPTPFYETVLAIGIFLVLMGLRKKLPFWGQLTGVYFFLNGTERFFIEKIRVNSTYELLGLEFTQAEMISLAMMISGIALFCYVTFIRKKNPGIIPAPEWLTKKENPSLDRQGQ